MPSLKAICPRSSRHSLRRDWLESAKRRTRKVRLGSHRHGKQRHGLLSRQKPRKGKHRRHRERQGRNIRRLRSVQKLVQRASAVLGASAEKIAGCGGKRRNTGNKEKIPQKRIPAILKTIQTYQAISRKQTIPASQKKIPHGFQSPV